MAEKGDRGLQDTLEEGRGLFLSWLCRYDSRVIMKPPKVTTLLPGHPPVAVVPHSRYPVVQKFLVQVILRHRKAPCHQGRKGWCNRG